MKHPLQRVTIENAKLVKQYIAKCMPQGAKKGKLLAVLRVREGFTHYISRTYLRDLVDAGEIVWDIENQVYRLPTEE